MESAIFGLVGVIIGAALTTAKEVWFDHRRQKKDATFLSIQVVFMLDRFISECISITRDDGLSYGSRDKDGCKVPQVKRPTFDPKSIDAEWKCLPPSLMYDILNLPLLIEKSNDYIDAVMEYQAGPPDYEEFFDARIVEFSELGLQSLKLSETLRENSKLPNSPESEDGWSRREILAKAKVQSLESTEKRNKANKSTWEEIQNKNA